jgi:TusA-related sulfurtransferase
VNEKDHLFKAAIGMAVACFLISVAMGRTKEADWKQGYFQLSMELNGKDVKTNIGLFIKYCDQLQLFVDKDANSLENDFIQKQTDILYNHFDEYEKNAFRPTPCATWEPFCEVQKGFMRNQPTGVAYRYRWGGLDLIDLITSGIQANHETLIVVRLGSEKFKTGYCYLMNPIIQNIYEVHRKGFVTDEKWKSAGKYRAKISSPISSPKSTGRYYDAVEIRFDGRVVKSNGAKLLRDRVYENTEPYGEVINAFVNDIPEWLRRKMGSGAEVDNGTVRFILDTGPAVIVYSELTPGKLSYRTYVRQKMGGYIAANRDFQGPFELLLDMPEFKENIIKICESEGVTLYGHENGQNP